MAEGKLAKFYEQVCLVEQPFVKDPNRKVKDVLAERGKVVVARFARFRLGEAVSQEE
ncbi:MAG: hypothetical protein ACK42L_08665 [Thermoanaerobaculum sp.]